MAKVLVSGRMGVFKKNNQIQFPRRVVEGVVCEDASLLRKKISLVIFKDLVEKKKARSCQSKELTLKRNYQRSLHLRIV